MLTPFGRRLLVERILFEARPPATVAEVVGVSRATANRWLRRYRIEALLDWRTDRPVRGGCPRRSRSERSVASCAVDAGWMVGPTNHHKERGEWLMYAFDPAQGAAVGVWNREWTAVAPTEEAVVREMARCLAEISAGRVPR